MASCNEEADFREGSPPRLLVRFVACYYFLMYSEKSVRCMSPLRASVSCMAKAVVRQY